MWFIFGSHLGGLRSSDESSEQLKTSVVDLRLSTIQSMHVNVDGDGSSFAKNGMDERRIKDVLKTPPCSCGCKIPYAILVKTCRTFWSLDKTSQDSLLWSLQCETGRKQWSIEGLGWGFNKVLHVRSSQLIHPMFIHPSTVLHGRPPGLSYCVAPVSWHRKRENQPHAQVVPWDWWKDIESVHLACKKWVLMLLYIRFVWMFEKDIVLNNKCFKQHNLFWITVFKYYL